VDFFAFLAARRLPYLLGSTNDEAQLYYIAATVLRIATDSGIVCSTLDTARRAEAAGLPVFMYNFDIPWSVNQDLLGACHVSEISMVFDAPFNEVDENLPVAKAMNAYWASFAKTGDPNYKDAPAEWPHFGHDSKSGDSRLQFDPGAKYEVVRSFRNEECALWADYAKQQ
jgi:carboxylesterase type B